MFRRLFSAFSNSAQGAPTGGIPTGTRLYAVGDIHGRLDLLDDLLGQIERDDAARAPADSQVIFLGDLVDRGPQSAQVIQRLLDLSQRTDKVRFLLGNHEEVFLKALKGEKGAMQFFVRIGGKATVLSYGVSEAEYQACDYAELAQMLCERVPAAHIAFLERFEDLIEIGDFAFVHAGIRPDLPLAEQKPATLRWIREEFIDHRGPFEKIIVHGHTITKNVDEQKWRIGIDTGAFDSGKLTAMGFEATQRWVLQTG
jgi:serine/threonine protein phosphatase 1